MNIRLLEPAQAELDEAIAWYAEQAPGLGDAFLVEALKTLRLVEQFPEAWSTPKMAQTFWCSPSRTSTANPAIGSIATAEHKAPFRCD